MDWLIIPHLQFSTAMNLKKKCVLLADWLIDLFIYGWLNDKLIDLYMVDWMINWSIFFSSDCIDGDLHREECKVFAALGNN